jgi:hypothetical protein
MQTSYQFRCNLWLTLLLSSIMHSACSKGVTPFITSSSSIIALDSSSGEHPANDLVERSRALAVRYRTIPGRDARSQAMNEIQITIRAAASLNAQHPLDWGDLIQKDKAVHHELAVEEFLCAEYLLEPKELIAIIRQQDMRTTPIQLRIACHDSLWRIDPKEAYTRARNLMFREKPRAGDLLRPRYLEKMLLNVQGHLANELLLSIAAEGGMEARARSLAISAVVKRNMVEAAPIFESVFDTEATNFLIRKDALLAVLKLDQQRGISILVNKMPQRTSDIGLFTFMTALREQYNVK